MNNGLCIIVINKLIGVVLKNLLLFLVNVKMVFVFKKLNNIKIMDVGLLV